MWPSWWRLDPGGHPRRPLRWLARLRRADRPARGAAGLSAALAGQVHCAREGAELARAMVYKQVTPEVARERIAVVEHRGDTLRSELIEGLGRTLVAPLDREDLFRLSRSVDDVLDTIRDFVRESDLYRIEGRATYRPFADAVVDAVALLEDAMQLVWDSPEQVPLRALDAKRAARVINREYQVEFANIVGSALTPRSLKHRELIKRLDWVGVRISEAADVLADGALKRGY